ncbi:hybrid sensor histidine kinase/response regulator [Desulfobacula phenolica]|uniref:histidine kinase n=1 Tax=Desulfobacula phenolica TaxID=90732 RepID=A0A1H2DP73_9BACT|nr:ABC transporter substrate binding protein [Desulfobacula phenolica]SDT84168.1 PAS domain S-box-containing protein [Desulfobacula phenolica]
MARPVRLRTLYFILVFTLLIFTTTVEAVVQISPRRILILHSYHKGLGWTDNIAQGIDKTLHNSQYQIEIFTEYMDTKRIFNNKYLGDLTALFKYKYHNKKFDVIISSDDHAFQFLRRHHDNIFPHTPVVFCGVNDFKDEFIATSPYFTGVVESFGIKETIEAALSIHPDLRRVYSVVDETVTGKANLELLKDVIPDFKDRLEFITLTDMDMTNLTEKVSRLPADSIVLLLAFTFDKSGNTFSLEQSADLITTAANQPVYSCWDFNLNHGILGGMLTTGNSHGITAAKLALRIIKGESPANITVIKKSPNRYIFDFNILNKFSISTKDLPPDSKIINQPLSFYKQYKQIVWQAVVMFTLLLIFSITISINLVKKRAAEIRLKKNEKEILHQKKLAERYLNLAGVIFIGLDINGNVNLANQKAYKTLECNEKDILGLNWFDNFIPQSIRNDVRLIFKQLMNRNIELAEYYENPVISKTGKQIIIAWHNTYIKNDDDQIIGMLASGEDITEKRQLESRLRQAQKMESIGNLAGGIAHDFNNILFPIVGMSEILLEDLPDGSPEYENAREILIAGKRGSDLVKQILAFSRQSENKLTPIRIQQVLRDVMKLCRATIPADIEIFQEIQSDCGLVLSDPTQLHQVAMDLITNAYHAMDSGSGKIIVQLKETRIQDHILVNISLKSGWYARLTVSDTGKGIDPEIIDKIFEPYFTTKEQGKGTGLGLAFVHGIIKEHGGDIQVSSTPGKGSTFDIYIPLMKKPVVTDSVKTVEMLQTGKGNILLVDDEPSVARLEKRMLERLGYQATAYIKSPDALKAFQSAPNDFNLVITDMTMPDMTGDQLSKKILSIKPDIPIIICTGFSERINEEKAKAIGVKGFLIKPVLKSEMAQMVKKVMDEEWIYNP